MPVETVPQQWVFSCDCCKAAEARDTAAPPPKWIGISVDQAAVDWNGSACADASVKLLLCRSCGFRATGAMNAEFDRIRAAITKARTP